jgi:hypothetical protein
MVCGELSRSECYSLKAWTIVRNSVIIVIINLGWEILPGEVRHRVENIVIIIL